LLIVCKSGKLAHERVRELWPLSNIKNLR
jgi:hypothetical protein